MASELLLSASEQSLLVSMQRDLIAGVKNHLGASDSSTKLQLIALLKSELQKEARKLLNGLSHQDKINFDPLLRLPPEMFQLILAYLHPKEIVHLIQVSSKWFHYLRASC